MLFNSYVFIFAFLPVVFFGFQVIKARSRLGALLFLAAASLFFYGWWDPANLPLIVSSIAINYGFGRAIQHFALRNRSRAAYALLAIAIVTDLAILGYYKYFEFFASIIAGQKFAPALNELPLGISFFTFTQIMYLVDSARKDVSKHDSLSYVLFVTWFPHLIAGPLLHHKQIVPQFNRVKSTPIPLAVISAGLTLFCIGLAKKCLLADNIGWYIAPSNALSAFTRAAAGVDVGFLEAWAGALAYTCQLYFDFSGYSDMAVGLSAMFGVKIPINFNSPYKASSIQDFWRRWHITLSHFLRDYLYFPLGGNRNRPLFNLLVTMLLGGIWHGAGWTFVVWGAMHGVYLAIHRIWRRSPATSWLRDRGGSATTAFAARALTFVCVVVAWVVFRAHTLSAARTMLTGMIGANGIAISGTAQPLELLFGWTAVLLAIAFFAPNSQQIIALPIWLESSYAQPAKANFPRWSPSPAWGALIGLLFVACLLSLSRPTQFLYFQF